MDETAALTPGAHRAIRMLDAQESAYPGELITDGERRGVRVDAETVAEQLWDYAGAEHVVGVRDVLRRADGHDAVLPWCADRVEAFLGRRAAAESALTAGETVTLVGSLLRGIEEAGDRSATGQWWLTDEARPVFAPGEGVGCAESAVALIVRLREEGADRAMNRLLDEIGAAAADRRMVRRSIERWERELTELAAPRPLVRDAYTPERVAAIPARSSRLRAWDPYQDLNLLAVGPGAAQRPLDRLVQTVQGIVARVGAALPRRRGAAATEGHVAEPSARVPRGRMLMVGGATAALVLVGGLMWPAQEDTAATEQAGEAVLSTAASLAPEMRSQPQAGATSPAETAEEVSPTPLPDPMLDGSAEQRAAVLLRAVLECARLDDAVCADAIADGAGATVQERLARTDAKRIISAVEDYGDVSVLRLGPSGERGEQMLVLVMQKDRWLVRDVYDVADQPSG